MDLVSENVVVQKISTSRKDDIFIECCETFPKDTNVMETEKLETIMDQK